MARQPSTYPSPKLNIHPTALIAQDTDLRGPGMIKFNQGCIVHPKASIQALNGDIEFGRDCVIEEGAKIINNSGRIMKIGEGNMFMISCHVESSSIGNFNTFQPRSQVSSKVNISNHCTISAGVTLLPSPQFQSTIATDDTSLSNESDKETLPPYTVVYSSEALRRTWDGATLEAENNLRLKHIEYLREILPKLDCNSGPKADLEDTTECDLWVDPFNTFVNKRSMSIRTISTPRSPDGNLAGKWAAPGPAALEYKSHKANVM